MASQNKEGKTKRRTVLQTIGTAAGFGLAGVPATARQTDSPVEFEGISYDSKTDVEQGLTRATLEFEDDGVSGELQISGLRIPIDDRTEVVSESEFGHSYRFELDDKQFKEDGVPLKGGFRTDGERLGGHLTRTGHRYHPLGFSMHNAENDVSVEEIRGILSDEEDVPSEIILPETGVPRLDREKRASYEPPSQDESSSINESDTVTSSSSDHQIIPTDDELEPDSEFFYPDDHCTYDDMVADYRFYELTYSLFKSEGLAPDPDANDDSVELAKGGNRVLYLHGVWNDGYRPENVIHDECWRSDWPAEAISAEYSVATIEDDLSPNNMLPDEDEGDGGLSEWVDTALDVVDAFPSTWTSVGTSVVRLFLPDEDTSYISTEINYGGGATECHWEFDLDYRADKFPTVQEEAQTVRVTLADGGNPTGSKVEVDLHSEYSYNYVTHVEECPCYDWTWKTGTTDVSMTFEMEVVDLD